MFLKKYARKLNMNDLKICFIEMVYLLIISLTVYFIFGWDACNWFNIGYGVWFVWVKVLSERVRKYL